MDETPLIAIVDDDAAALAAIVSLVRSMDYRAEGFLSAGAFLQSPAVGTAVCLIADLRMPVMSGLDLHASLISSRNPIPTILVTAYPDENARRRALQAGIGGFLIKPLDPQTLLRSMRIAIAQSATTP